MSSLAPVSQAPVSRHAASSQTSAFAGRERRDRRAPSPIKAYGSLERAFAACGLIGAAGTTGGAVLTVHGYGAAPLLGATSLVLLVCACLGIWAMDQVIRFQRGEVARVYASALDAPRRAVFERRRADPTRMEVLGVALADMVESLRMRVFGGDHVRLWAVAMRRALDGRAQTAQALAAALNEDAHAIAAAATAARRAETDIGADVGALFAHAGRAAEATANMADQAEALQASVRQTTAHLRQASTLAASLADNAMNAQRGVTSVSEVVDGLLHAADQMKAVLQRAELAGLNAATEAAQAGEAGPGFSSMAAELKSLAASGHIALETMMQAVRGLKVGSAAMTQTVVVINDGVQAQAVLGQTLGETVSNQMAEVARVVAKAGLAKGEIIALQQRASAMERRELGLSAGPAARCAIERMPAHAEAIANILRDLPQFEPAK